MATFEVQVEGLTSLTLDGSSAPTQDELTQFLTDGAKEIINILPINLLDWCSAQQTFTSTAVGSESETMNTGKILRVYRNDGEIDRACRRIKADLKGHATDKDEMMYATVTDPVFYTENNKINVLPEGGSCKYDEVAYPAVLYSASAVAAFPDDAEYLVVLYGAVKALQNVLGSMNSFIIHSDQDASYSSSSSSSQGWEKVRDYIESDEDTELSSSLTSALSQEMQQFIREYDLRSGQQAKLQADYYNGIQKLLSRYG